MGFEQLTINIEQLEAYIMVRYAALTHPTFCYCHKFTCNYELRIILSLSLHAVKSLLLFEQALHFPFF